jgi:hypothetical protein
MYRAFSRVVIVALALLGSVAVARRLEAQAPCPALPPPTGPVIEVQPSQTADLPGIVANAATGTTVLLHDGTYDLDGATIAIATAGLTLRSASGDREAVVLDGNYVSGELISIQASDTTIADLTLRRAYYHPIHVSGPEVPISGVLIHNVHIIDPGEQAVKVNPVGEGTVDHSALQCSLIELTDEGRPLIRNNCYTGGLDAHAATGWRVWRNRIEGFWCDVGLSEHGIHLWRASADTVVEENVIVDCARGIGFGLGSGADGHSGGVIRNNFVGAADAGLFASEYGFDAGIALWGAEGAAVYHNTVASTQAPFSSIEWRYISTSVTLANNLTTGPIRDRGGVAVLDTNLSGVPVSLFADVAAGDFHLVDPLSSPVGGGTSLPPGVCDGDLDGQRRDASPDVGADEFGQPLFSDGFEFGTTNAWSAVYT